MINVTIMYILFLSFIYSTQLGSASRIFPFHSFLYLTISLSTQNAIIFNPNNLHQFLIWPTYFKTITGNVVNTIEFQIFKRNLYCGMIGCKRIEYRLCYSRTDK